MVIYQVNKHPDRDVTPISWDLPQKRRVLKKTDVASSLNFLYVLYALAEKYFWGPGTWQIILEPEG